MNNKSRRAGWVAAVRDNILVTLISGVLAAAILAGVSAGVSSARKGLIVEFLGGVPESRLHTLPPFPAGAIVAFDRAEGCPEGWTLLEEAQGRTIVGVGTVSVDGSYEQEYRYRNEGGKAEVTLTDRHLPRHRHAYVDIYYTEREDFQPSGIDSVQVPRKVGSHGGRDDDNVGWVLPDTMTAFSGSEDQDAFTNMQPYIVLYYCKLN